ncbi:MAG: UDP-glucose 4-epimerase GalE [Defluviitaleaceae bacterium]|nr:UDP-glucose 4-epimerase GalE [Defluviitaleaceae bacterium]MCL2835545.1 UDP-glucose 4-epimerase GalE [Defluviitaleaceae bacterium]
MTVFVAGGAGYIGSHMCMELLGQNYDIVVADNFSNSKPEALKRIKELSGRDFPFYEADLCDPNVTSAIFEKHQIGCVIHFAGLKAVGESVKFPVEYYNNNLMSTISLCGAMKLHGVNNFIFSSSATVYRGDNEMPLTENSKTGDCSNPYGWTKYICERILRDAGAANPDWSVVLLRYFNVIGAHESGKIGEDPMGIPNNILPAIAQTAVGRIERLPVYGTDYPTPDGTCVRDYIHVTDLVKGHVAAIKYSEINTGVETFNLGTGRGTSNFEMITAFERASGVKLPTNITARRPGDLPVNYTSTEKAAEKLKWRAEKTVSEACADVWRWQSQNPHGYAQP